MLIKEAARSAAKYSSVAVIGGGIGGLSVANALLRKNVAARVSVYEQAKEFVPTVSSLVAIYLLMVGTSYCFLFGS